jgi:ABC-2 type transport system ATP-binding protein
MRRRLDLAISLLRTPPVVFLDEPTTGLDPASRQDLWGVIRHLADNGTTVLLTTQYLEEADQLADRVGIIDDGKIVAEGTPAALKAKIGRPSLEVVPSADSGGDRVLGVLERFGERVPASREAVAVRLNDGAEQLTDIVRALDAEGLRVADIDLRAPSLDDVFLEKTGRHLEGAGDDPDAEGAKAGMPEAGP